MMSALMTADCLRSGGYFAISRSIFLRESVVSIRKKSRSDPNFQKSKPPDRLRLSPPLSGGRQQRQASPVDLSKDNILSADDRDGVGDHVAARHLVERGEVREAGSADLEPVGLVGAVADEVDAELALGRFHHRVHL